MTNSVQVWRSTEFSWAAHLTQQYISYEAECLMTSPDGDHGQYSEGAGQREDQAGEPVQWTLVDLGESRDVGQAGELQGEMQGRKGGAWREEGGRGGQALTHHCMGEANYTFTERETSGLD